MLLHELYQIISLTESAGQIRIQAELQAGHPIFTGHFPGHPVLPGVCMMEMISEMTGEFFKETFQITGGPVIKFLLMIDPNRTPSLFFEINYQQEADTIAVHGKIFRDTEIFMKFQMNLVSEKHSAAGWSSKS